MMRVRFWGVRGSVPHASTACMGYGCNTACLEVVDEASGRRLILDAGTGIVGLGDALETDRHEIPILLTHYHWDHVQGLPYFGPVYQEGAAVSIWAPALAGAETAVVGAFDRPYHPVTINEVASQPVIHTVRPGEVTINGFDIRIQPLNHPGGAFAYRVRGAGRDLVYLTDHEFGNPSIDGPLSAFAEGAGGIILDAHFTPDELPFHTGWGHADWRQCASFAHACGAGRLWLIHHKPGRTDEAINGIVAEARGVFVETRGAREGETFTL